MRPPGSIPRLVVTKDRLTRALSPDGYPEGAGFGQRTPTVSMACGAVIDVLFRQLITVGSIGDPMTDAVAALSSTTARGRWSRGSSAFRGSSWPNCGRRWSARPTASSRRWPRLNPAWLPRTQEALRVGVADGAVELSARVDLAVGRPGQQWASVAIVEVKSGARRIERRADGISTH